MQDIDELHSHLERQRRRLTRLVERALRQGRALATDAAILAQSRSVDRLINKVTEQRRGGA
ncbi:MAG: hypothetical protein PHO66_03835 [Eubacteriales bacterium]|nr:hypothetical protein [Eubacteriales bacterium]